MANPATLDQPGNDPIAASTRLIESTIELARAELRLALTRAGVLLTRAFGVLIAVVIAMPFVQVTLALVALAPLLGALESVELALLAAGIPFVVSVIAGLFLYRASRSLTRELKELSRGE